MVSITTDSLHAVAKAMAIADEMEHTIPTFSFESAETKQDFPDEPSLEDIAWADSCVSKDPDMSQNDWNSWNSFRDALNETLSSGTDSLVAEIENHPKGHVIGISPSSQQTGSSRILGTRAVGDLPIIKGADKNSEDQLISEFANVIQSEMNLENVFLPTLNENLENIGVPDTGEGMDIPGFVTEQSTDQDIFKVWDLGVPTEGEFINQLNEVLVQSSSELSPSVVSYDTKFEGLENIATLDDIISGISDLSLNHLPM